MARFPRLNNGAIAQYPCSRISEARTRVVSYMDGSEQRVSLGGAPIRRWILRFDGCGAHEMDQLVRFYEQHKGSGQLFEFEDPWTGTVYDKCRFEEDALRLRWAGEMRGQAVVTIRSEE